VPERIKEDRDGYENALETADKAWDNGQLDFTQMEEYLLACSLQQLNDDGI